MTTGGVFAWRPPPEQHRTLTLLLVEDDEVDVISVRRALEDREGAQRLFVAPDGADALAQLRGGTVPRQRRLVLLDLNLPKMNGIEFLRELRADPQLQSTPVVVLTHSTDERDKITAYELNVAGYLQKPGSPGEWRDLMTILYEYWALVEMA